MKRIYIIAVFLVLTGQLVSQQRHTYKIVGPDSLAMDIYLPKIENQGSVPAIVFFFGGGWSKRNFDQFRPHATYFSERGLVTILVDYRVSQTHGTSPGAALRDAKSAIRFIREQAGHLGIDPGKIIAAGGSAGGHLAAACAVIEGFNESSDDQTISPKPDALVLYNPVVDNGPGGYGFTRVKDYYKDFSPLHNLHQNTPPTLFMLGTKDRLIPVETALYYQKVMEKMDLRCEVKLYEGEGHGFFNYRHFEMYQQTVRDTDEFLQSLGYLKGEPQVQIK